MNPILPVLGYRRDGRPILPMAGGDGTEDLAKSIDDLTLAVLRTQALREAQGKGGMSPEEVRQTVNDVLKAQVGPSRASQVGSPDFGAPQGLGQDVGVLHPFLAKASLGPDVRPGDFLTAVMRSRSPDASEQAIGKASLGGWGIGWAEAPEVGKATLGTTGATGGYVLPNNLIQTPVEKPAIGAIDWEHELSVRTGVAVRGVDQPYRLGAPARMTYQNWGITKENVDETYGSYSANLVTFARIMDVAKQYMRFSAGAAEQDVLDELAKAARLAVEYEVLAGPGTGTTGSGDACLGILTSLNDTPNWLGLVTAKTGAASNSTVAGSFAAALAEMGKLMSARARFPSVFVVDSQTYWTVLSQGSDTAGFWSSPTNNGGFTIDAEGGLRFWGVPVRHSPNFDAYAVAAGGATKSCLALDGPAFRIFKGMEFRIDSSDQAGDRWDKNLIGFRGEMEMGFNAETGVHVGAAQLMTAVIP